MSSEHSEVKTFEDRILLRVGERLRKAKLADEPCVLGDMIVVDPAEVVLVTLDARGDESEFDAWESLVVCLKGCSEYAHRPNLGILSKQVGLFEEYSRWARDLEVRRNAYQRAVEDTRNATGGMAVVAFDDEEDDSGVFHAPVEGPSVEGSPIGKVMILDAREREALDVTSFLLDKAKELEVHPSRLYITLRLVDDNDDREGEPPHYVPIYDFGMFGITTSGHKRASRMDLSCWGRAFNEAVHDFDERLEAYRGKGGGR